MIVRQLKITLAKKEYRMLSHRVGISHPLNALSIDDCRYIRIVKLVLKILQNICVVIKTTTACVCRRAKDGVASAAAGMKPFATK